jgi:hypothetical protein
MLGNQMSKYSRTNNPLPLVCKLRASAARGVATEVQFLNQTCLSENKGVVGVACSTLPIRFLLICNVLPCCYLPHLGDYPPRQSPTRPQFRYYCSSLFPSIPTSTIATATGPNKLRSTVLGQTSIPLCATASLGIQVNVYNRCRTKGAMIIGRKTI